MRAYAEIGAAIVAGAAVLVAAAVVGFFAAPRSHPAGLPCHTAALMSRCVLDISQHNAVAIGSPRSSVTTSCRAQSAGWACFTGFRYQGGRVCLISYLVEGRVTGIPVFIRNVQAAPAVCGKAPPA